MRLRSSNKFPILVSCSDCASNSFTCLACNEYKVVSGRRFGTRLGWTVVALSSFDDNGEVEGKAIRAVGETDWGSIEDDNDTDTKFNSDGLIVESDDTIIEAVILSWNQIINWNVLS